eukprot:SAG31_NODE_2795_length_5082_cov_2.673289_5_plen_67_part_00
MWGGGGGGAGTVGYGCAGVGSTVDPLRLKWSSPPDSKKMISQYTIAAAIAAIAAAIAIGMLQLLHQ